MDVNQVFIEGKKCIDFVSDDERDCKDCDPEDDTIVQIDYGESEFLVEGDENFGKRACISKETKVDGFYLEGNHFEKCIKGCLVCEDGETCEECGGTLSLNPDNGLCIKCSFGCK